MLGDYFFWETSPMMLECLAGEGRQVNPVNRLYLERETHGEFHHLYPTLRKQENLFRSYARMRTTTFDYIVEEIRSEFPQKATNFQRPISVEERLMVTSRFLATGISFRQLAFSYRISKSSVSRIVREVCAAIWKKLVKTHMPIPTVEQFEGIAKDFYSKWGFPNALACIDGKHIKVKCPPNSGSMFFNYKQFFSIVLMAVTDGNYKFIMVDVGAYGKDSDGSVFSNTHFYKKIENGSLPLPPSKTLPNSTVELPPVFLADEAFPLRKYLMRPFPWKQAKNDDLKRRFNYQLSRARMTVECSFGITSAKFRILLKAIETDIPAAQKIVKACTLLHNIIIDKEGPPQDYVLQEMRTHPGSSERERNVAASRNNNRCCDTAINIRNAFADYFLPMPRS